MTKDAQIEKEETLKKVLSGDLDDSHGNSAQRSALLSNLCAQVGCQDMVEMSHSAKTFSVPNHHFAKWNQIFWHSFLEQSDK